MGPSKKECLTGRTQGRLGQPSPHTGSEWSGCWDAERVTWSLSSRGFTVVTEQVGKQTVSVE